MSAFTQYPPATSESASAYFAQKLANETDCSDVFTAMQQQNPPFVLLHVIGSPVQFAKKHIPGAVHFPHGLMNPETLASWPAETLFVVYCAGPHCNGADKAAYQLAKLGRPVKVMLGGLTGWQDEGYTFAAVR